MTKRIGILGGISAESTAAYYDRIIHGYYERCKNYHYPEIVIFSLNFQRFTDLENTGDRAGYVAEIMGGIGALEAAGVDFVLMAANSPHAVFGEVATRATVPMLSIVEVTAREAQAKGLDNLLLLGIKFTMQSSFYQEAFAGMGMTVSTPSEAEQNEIEGIIFDELTRGVFRDSSRARLLKIIEGHSVDGIILGCTELPLLLSQVDVRVPLLDTLELHTRAALDYALEASASARFGSMGEGEGLCAQAALPFEPEMVLIPAGPFWMGTSTGQIQWLASEYEPARKWVEKGYFDRERPHHLVMLDEYWIGRYPVTVGQYRAFVEAAGYSDRRVWTAAGWCWREGRLQPDYWDDEAWAGDVRLPVVGVSWYEAYAYCRWLSEETGRGYRLPSEAEWEKAARGTDGRMWPWGNGFDAAFCNVRATEVGRTVPVGRFGPAGDSPFGCAEMVGNVSEWTATRFDVYPVESGGGREDPAGDAERVTRGGSWHSPILRARTVSRGMNDPFFVDYDLGFRCACSPLDDAAG